MSSKSATLLVVFVVACIAFCIASVFGAMTEEINILPDNQTDNNTDNESVSGYNSESYSSYSSASDSSYSQDSKSSSYQSSSSEPSYS